MTYIPERLRRLVVERASDCCEYCRLAQKDAFQKYQIDHIIAEKHDSETTANNLCLSCVEYNRYKGSDVASYDKEKDDVVRLFHPRRDHWQVHFRLHGARVQPLTPEGRATVKLLRLNESVRILERSVLISLGHYPCKIT